MTSEPDATATRTQASPWTMLALLGGVLILSMSTWFSATAILPQLQAAFGLSAAGSAWATNAVQAGFVVAALASSVLGLADRVPGRALLVAASLLAAVSNAAMLAAPDAAWLLAARFATGAALAGIYPTALKIIATWFVRSRGIAMGAAVGALTLGSASPYLVKAVGAQMPWGLVVGASSAAALAAAALAVLVREGPNAAPRRPFDFGSIARVLRDRPLMLANLGYFGHMWEVYALWGWFLAFATGAPAVRRLAISPALLTFVVIAIGALGCLAGGWAADRVGRTLTTMVAMAISGACALAVGAVFDGPTWLFVAIALVWGVAVIADSAQFSAMASELSDPETVGAALALQVGIGFALTIASIRLTPLLAAAIGWRWSFVVLAPGPLLGCVAIAYLRTMPRAGSIAGGRR